MSGKARGLRAVLLRAALSAAEPLYAGAAASRNWLFDSGVLRSHPLPRPVISVGNITTGGTGKTPLVRWLAGRLRESGRTVAVLARGYGARPGQLGDEQLMLQRLLNEADSAAAVAVIADPDRVSAAKRLLRERPEVDAFVLDDGFQHRRLARDLDIVVVSATNPFGYGHVLPRGLLREPLRGLRRAGAVVITHADQVPQTELVNIESCVRKYEADVPVFQAVHALGALYDAEGGVRPLDELRGRSWFAVCGIGNPQTFLRQLECVGGSRAGHRWFPDHHPYSDADLANVRRQAREARADVLVTTEKDWAKLEALSSSRDADLAVWRVDLKVRILDNGELKLWDQVRRVVAAPRFHH